MVLFQWYANKIAKNLRERVNERDWVLPTRFAERECRKLLWPALGFGAAPMPGKQVGPSRQLFGEVI